MPILVLLAFFNRRDAVFDSPDMNHDANPVEHQDADAKSGGSKSREETENDRNWCDQKKKDGARDFVAFVDVA